MTIMNTHHLIIDRITAHTAHVQDHETGLEFSIPRAWLPTNAKAGEAFKATFDLSTGITELSFDANLTRELQERMTNLRASIPKAPSGDVDI